MELHEFLTPIVNVGRYLGGMSKSLEDKMMVCDYIPKIATSILDVGCADGSVTIEIARRFPNAHVLGIDLDEEFVQRARERAEKEKVQNVFFEKVFLRDLLVRGARYDAVTFISVLHEFYSYGQGMSSVFKAFADAHELLEQQGVVVIRDMIVPRYFREVTNIETLAKKVQDREHLQTQLVDFEKNYCGEGGFQNLLALNHFLLKYPYIDNWEYELRENYLAVTLDDYVDFIRLVGMRLQNARPYLLPYLRDLWKREFNFSENELNTLYSTSIISAVKI